MKELRGRVITGIDVGSNSNDRGERADAFLRFSSQDGEAVIYETEGDCCSETWFAEVINPESVLGEKVLSIDWLDLPNPLDGHSRQDLDGAYGYSLNSSKGACRVIFRNSSNGYYGGRIRLSGPSPKIVWTPVTKDWTAWGNG